MSTEALGRSPTVGDEPHEQAVCRGMAFDVPFIEIRIWQSDAIVLFDWLMSTDLNTVPISHPAQKQALADLLTRLEETIDTSVTQQQIDIAQAEVARDMGW